MLGSWAQSVITGHFAATSGTGLPILQHHCLLGTPPGTSFMVVNGRFGGFGMGREIHSDVLIHRLDMAHPRWD